MPWFKVANTINIEYEEQEDGILLLKIDTKLNFGPTTSGKSDIVASTRGAVGFPSGLQLNLNAYVKR